MVKTDFWAIFSFERGRHPSIPNALGRASVPCIIPMVTDFNSKNRVEYQRPALINLGFFPADETYAQRAMDIVYIEAVWRRDNGDLQRIPDQQVQHFLDGLARRERKPAKARRTMNLGGMAEREFFALWRNLYGLQAAIKRFGRDLSDKEAA